MPLPLLPPRHVPVPCVRRTAFILDSYFDLSCDPSHAGVVLPAHYATREAVEALLSLGDLSALGCSLAECEAYYRDRGEELHKPTHWSDRWVLAREAFDRFWGGVQLPLHGWAGGSAPTAVAGRPLPTCWSKTKLNPPLTDRHL